MTTFAYFATMLFFCCMLVIIVIWKAPEIDYVEDDSQQMPSGVDDEVLLARERRCRIIALRCTQMVEQLEAYEYELRELHGVEQGSAEHHDLMHCVWGKRPLWSEVMSLSDTWFWRPGNKLDTRDLTRAKRCMLRKLRESALNALGQEWRVLLESLDAPNYVVLGLSSLDVKRRDELYDEALKRGAIALLEAFPAPPKKKQRIEKREQKPSPQLQSVERLLKAVEQCNGSLSRATQNLFEEIDATGSVWKRRFDQAHRQINIVLQEVRDEHNL